VLAARMELFMTSEDKYKYWVMLSDYDIETAQVLLDAKRYMYVTYTCEQAVEHLLNGMHVFYIGKEAPKSHNIIFILNQLQKDNTFSLKVNMADFELRKEKYEDFFADLIFYYMSDYPFSYKKIMDRFVSEEVATDMFIKTKEVLSWLKSLQQKH
jgi:HEPN domain-containing protein